MTDADELSSRAHEYLAGLMTMFRFMVASGADVPPVAVELARTLHAQSVSRERVSEAGSSEIPHETIGDVREYGTPDEAGSAVGLSGRRVRQLCDAGLVAHRVIGKNRKLVDLADLQRYLRGAA